MIYRTFRVAAKLAMLADNAAIFMKEKRAANLW
jgi:hypothetical protein